MSKAPSAILSDALTSFNRAATLAFTAAQDQARKDVAHATTDAREARRERDDAVHTLHAAQLEEQAWKEEAGVWKASANQAELTINHHLETIAQLRQEANQWKNQCLRLEETSRQEAVSWKEQFLRVEQERSKLAQRVEELVAEQLSTSGHAQVSTAPYTPMPKHSTMKNLSASTRLQLSPSPDPLMSYTSKTTSGVNRNRPGPNLQLPTPLSENQRNSRQRATQETIPPVFHPIPRSNGPRQIVIRRVQAVVEVPVKEESVGPENVGPVPTTTSNIPSTSGSIPKSASTTNIPSTSGSIPKSASTTKTPKAPCRTAEPSRANTRVKRKAATKRAYVEIDDDSDQDNASQDAEQNDADEFQPVSDGDDELLMGIETNRKEVYGMKRARHVEPAEIKSPSSTMLKRRKAPPSSKKSRPFAASKP